MFRTIFTKSLRDYRWAILGWGIGLGLAVYAQYATFASALSGASTAQLQQLMQQFSFFGETRKLNTPGGFVTFKMMGLLPEILGIWTVLAGARMTRGEEDRGTLDILLSTPHSRLSLLGQKLLALATATGLICVLIAVWIMGGMASAKVTVDPGAALLATADAGLVAFFYGALALLLAQVVGRGAAAGWTGGLMVFFFLLDGTGRAVSSSAGLRYISPSYAYDLNVPLVPGYAPQWGALIVLVGLCVVVSAAVVPLFLRRDVGRSVLADVAIGRNRESYGLSAGRLLARAGRDVWLRGVGLQALRRQGVAMFWWIVSLSIFAGYLVVVAQSSEKQLQDLIGNSAVGQQLFSGANIGTNNGFLSVLVFGYIQLLLPIFAGIMAYGWATDLDNGRLELTLSAPQSRWRVILARYGAVLGAAFITTVCIWLAIMLVAQVSGFSVEAGRVAQASLGMLPLELITASLVFALAGLLPPGLVIGIMSVFLGVSFLADTLRTLLKLPEWAINLSIFHQYGSPIMDGLNWGAFGGMLAIALALLALGGWQFAARDVDRGAA